jgi:hypothetical protein
VDAQVFASSSPSVSAKPEHNSQVPILTMRYEALGGGVISFSRILRM